MPSPPPSPPVSNSNTPPPLERPMEAAEAAGATAQVLAYAKWAGIDVHARPDLMWLAEKGLVAPLPDGWMKCAVSQAQHKAAGADVYYFNRQTGQSMWDHPLDCVFQELARAYEKAGAGSCGESPVQDKKKFAELIRQRLNGECVRGGSGGGAGGVAAGRVEDHFADQWIGAKRAQRVTEDLLQETLAGVQRELDACADEVGASLSGRAMNQKNPPKENAAALPTFPPPTKRAAGESPAPWTDDDWLKVAANLFCLHVSVCFCIVLVLPALFAVDLTQLRLFSGDVDDL
ncbi:hypothetical protein DIPPA_27908 [Diplonema papillatum]|nr:hypothetical protein DIPPA_27908 [Diplonema papillatum]